MIINAPSPRRVVIVGLGGIGSWVLQALAPFLYFRMQENPENWNLVLVDGDEYEEKNKSRQAFDELGPKAQVQASWVARKYPAFPVQAITQYLSADGAEDTYPVNSTIRSGDIVFSCLDNHKTRKMVADHCATLREVVLISGGNEYTDGNIQVFIRKNGEDKTCRIDKYHPELTQPADKAPFEMSCEELAASSPQLIFTNLNVATLMLNAFYTLEQKKFNYEKSEGYFDVLQNTSTPRVRKN